MGSRARLPHGCGRVDGDVVHWLDADMLPHRDEVEAQLRWHHLIDHAVVMGHKRSSTCPTRRAGCRTSTATLAAVDEGRAGDLFGDRWTSEPRVGE